MAHWVRAPGAVLGLAAGSQPWLCIPAPQSAWLRAAHSPGELLLWVIELTLRASPLTFPPG